MNSADKRRNMPPKAAPVGRQALVKTYTGLLDVEILDRPAVEIVRDALIGKLHRYMPAGRYRDFYMWALSADNPDRDTFCRIIGLKPIAVMTAALLGDLLDTDDWPKLLWCTIQMNLYHIFEVVTDNNLGRGLARVRPNEPSEQRDLQIEFNNIIVADIRTPSAVPARELLADLRGPANAISGSVQNLVPDCHAEFARRDAETHRPTADTNLDHGVWLELVANVESCRDMLAAIEGTRTVSLVRDAAVDRYQADSRSLCTRQLPRLERAVLRAQRMLVVPTLGYFTAVLGELIGTDAGYLQTIDDGTLLETLSNAALLVRLQNDLGTHLLRMTPQQQHAFLRGLPERHPSPDKDEPTALSLLARASRAEPVLSRFRKDLTYSEFNVCLNELSPTDSIDDGLAALADSLAYFTHLYAQHQTQLVYNLTQLDNRLTDNRITALIRKSVLLHEYMYARPYDSDSGDYTAC